MNTHRTQHAIVFVNTKRDADDLVAELGMILKGTEALHGDIPQVLLLCRGEGAGVGVESVCVREVLLFNWACSSRALRPHMA